MRANLRALRPASPLVAALVLCAAGASCQLPSKGRSRAAMPAVMDRSEAPAFVEGERRCGPARPTMQVGRVRSASAPLESPLPPAPRLAGERDHHDPFGPGFARQGVFLGAIAALTEIDGEWDGNTILVDANNNLIEIPELTRELGYGGQVGYRWRKRSVEVTYERTTFDTTISSGPTEVLLSAVDFDLREYYLVDGPIQPYLTAGLGLMWATIDDGATDGLVSVDAKLKGVSAQAGAGLAFYLHPRVGVYVQGVYRFAQFTDADGIGEELPIIGDLDASGWGARAGLQVTL